LQAHASPFQTSITDFGCGTLAPLQGSGQKTYGVYSRNYCFFRGNGKTEHFRHQYPGGQLLKDVGAFRFWNLVHQLVNRITPHLKSALAAVSAPGKR
jgi:hypothetical protein